MIEFNDLKIVGDQPLVRQKWNDLLQWVEENPPNLSEQKLELFDAQQSSRLCLEGQTSYGLIESEDSKPLVINLNRNRVGVGTSTPTATLHVVNANQTANGNTLILGPSNQSNLRLGYHSSYSWIQSHGGKPLAINPLGNNVGIRTTSPKATLDVNGRIVAKSFGYPQSPSDKLITFRRFSNLGNNIRYNTGYKTADWNAGIAGFYAADGDILENDAGKIIEVRMIRKSGLWHIYADFRSHRNHESWSVDVMFARIEISRNTGF